VLQSAPTRAARACSPTSFRYARRQPEATVLHRIVREQLETFRQQLHTESGTFLPDFVANEFEGFLRCGVLAHGFLRLRCDTCREDHLVGFSCKGRGFCPSCGARRMAQTAAHLVDEILPDVPIRQWVLSLPIPLRVLRPPGMAEVRKTQEQFSALPRNPNCSRRCWRLCSAPSLVISRNGRASNVNKFTLARSR
jgi:hypothetical protein